MSGVMGGDYRQKLEVGWRGGCWQAHSTPKAGLGLPAVDTQAQGSEPCAHEGFCFQKGGL